MTGTEPGRGGQSQQTTGRVLVVIPTYNERNSLPTVLDRLHGALPEAHVLVVDDGSPDGTGDLVDEIAAADTRVFALHRRDKSGLGAAYLAGFAWALERSYAAIAEMDADGSHAPEDLPRLVHRLTRADLVIGSRYVPGGRVVNWPKHRELLSHTANWYSKVLLGAAVNDITSGFRVYRRAVLEQLDLHQVLSRGYCFQIDLAWRAVLAGFVATEVPITFTERSVGTSKMSTDILAEAIVNVTRWGIRRRAQQLRRIISGRTAP